MSLSSELAEKLNRVQAFLDREGLGAVILNTQRNFAWLTCGGSNHVGLATPDGVAALLVLRNGSRYLISPNNERPRISEEETAGLGFEPIEVPWHELRSNPLRLRDAIAEVVEPDSVGADSAIAGLVNVESSFAALRYRLTEPEIARYRIHARAVAEALEETAHAVEIGKSEREIESLLAFNLMRSGARPTVLLVAGDERFRSYRHPIATDHRIARYVALSTCAKRWGLTAAVTRLVHFGAVPEEIAERYRALQRVEVNLIAATRPGASAGDIFESLKDSYAAAGFSDEWREHHQGGATGYLEREWVATPGGLQRVESQQAFAWNPTIAGTKIEDTVIVTEAGTEIISTSGTWPCDELEVNRTTWARPRILVR